MRNLLLGVAFLLLATNVFAQKKSSKLDTYYGIRAGLALAKYDGKGIYDVNYKTNPGFFATIFADFAVSKKIILQPGISFQQKGTKFSTEDVALGSALSTATFQQNIMQVEVPINAIFTFDIGSAGTFQINAGPYIGYNFYGKNKNDGNFNSKWGVVYSGGTREIMFGNTKSDDLKSFDYGVNGGISFKTNYGFLVGGNYGWGFANLAPTTTSENKLENRVLSFSIGYAF